VRAVIFHINRATFKADLSEEQRQACLEMLHQSGATNPAVKSYVVGREFGGEFEYGAVYVVEDLDGYWQYLDSPVHLHEELTGMELLERFEVVDITDSDDPEIGEKIARLQVRHIEAHPELAALIADVPSFTVPDREGSPT
jgi:hypothetical protein